MPPYTLVSVGQVPAALAAVAVGEATAFSVMFGGSRVVIFQVCPFLPGCPCSWPESPGFAGAFSSAFVASAGCSVFGPESGVGAATRELSSSLCCPLGPTVPSAYSFFLLPFPAFVCLFHIECPGFLVVFEGEEGKSTFIFPEVEAVSCLYL